MYTKDISAKVLEAFSKIFLSQVTQMSISSETRVGKLWYSHTMNTTQQKWEYELQHVLKNG